MLFHFFTFFGTPCMFDVSFDKSNSFYLCHQFSVIAFFCVWMWINVFSNPCYQRKTFCNGRNCVTFPLHGCDTRVYAILEHETDISHKKHTCVAFLQCEQACASSEFLPDCNDLLQWRHLCGLSPVWVSRCSLRARVRSNDLSQWPHLWGFSWVWINMCFVRFPLSLNDVLHALQL